MDSDGHPTAGVTDSGAPVAPIAVKVRWWKPAGMLLIILLSSVALLLSTLAVQKNRAQDAATAKRVVLEQQRALIAQCEAFNQSRKNTYDSNMALALLAVSNSPDPTQLPTLVERFVKFTDEAFEPVSCNLHDSHFGQDPTSPEPLPPNPLVEALIQ